MTCSTILRESGIAYPRTCAECGLGPCKVFPGDIIQKYFGGPINENPLSGGYLQDFGRPQNNYGWICPKCGAGNAPTRQRCDCVPAAEKAKEA